MITHVIFDFDNTLSFGPIGDYTGFSQVKKRFKITRQQMEKANAYIHGHLKEYTSPQNVLSANTQAKEKQHHQTFYQNVVKASGINKDYVNWVVNRRLNTIVFGLYPDVLPTLKTLKEKQIGLSILTNAFRSRHQMFKRMGLNAYFKNYFISGETGLAKPDLKAYQHAHTIIKKPYKEILFIDDKPAFIEPAISLGMQGMFIVRKGREVPQHDTITMITTLNELLEKLENE